ncbi:MAG TPA: hypothetical protein DD727_08565 [Clostridiales bacterium]|nr:hypothetical protein [Clostridiales bacterium]
MADDMGDGQYRQELQDIYDLGIRSFEKKLWNGEYYNLWSDGSVKDECCMTDQISGEWFARLVGSGGFLSDERTAVVLKNIFKYNYSKEYGLMNGSYPKGRKPRHSTYLNAQAMATWTGIEYAFASAMIGSGFVSEATEIIRNVEDRYRRAGRIWNHIECGQHYYRAMSSWCTLLAITGFQVDVPRKTVRFAPAMDGEVWRAPWYACSGWGIMLRTQDAIEITCIDGTLEFEKIVLAIPGTCDPKFLFDDIQLKGVTTIIKKDEWVISLEECLCIREGQRVVCRIG